VIAEGKENLVSKHKDYSRLTLSIYMVKSKHLEDNISEETRKKIADEEFREIVKIANGHKKTLSALAKH